MDEIEPLSELPNEPIAAARAAEPQQSLVALLLRLVDLEKDQRAIFCPSILVLIGLSILWLLLWIGDRLVGGAAGSAISRRRCTAVCLVCAGNTGFGSVAALAIQPEACTLQRRCCCHWDWCRCRCCSQRIAVPFLSLDWRLAAIARVDSLIFYLARGLRAFTGEAQRCAAFAGIAFLLALHLAHRCAGRRFRMFGRAPEVAEAADDSDASCRRGNAAV